MYEPSHGTAPDIAGHDKANPLAAILSVAMLLEITCGMMDAALAVRSAVEGVLQDGYRTGDIFSEGTRLVSCSEMGQLVAKRVIRARK